jgi:hypothetical protein
MNSVTLLEDFHTLKQALVRIWNEIPEFKSVMVGVSSTRTASSKPIRKDGDHDAKENEAGLHGARGVNHGLCRVRVSPISL